MKLAQLQAMFQMSVLGEEPDPDFLAHLNPPARADRIEDVFAVYHEGFRLRMAEFLANDYPVLREALGDEAFGEIVAAYAAARPSRWRNARWFGAGLPDFLRETPLFSEDKTACGLAALEAALAKSFDAADAGALALEILGVTPQEDWPRLRFCFHPGVAMVETTAAALACYEAAQSEQSDRGAGDVGEEALDVLVWRDGLEVNYRALDEWEALALREALRGAPFGEICGLLAFARPQEPAERLTMTAAGFLGQWFSAGMIVAAGP